MQAPDMTNPHEQKNRLLKVVAISDHLWSTLTDQDRIDPELVPLLSAAPRELRDQIAADAGQNAPSEESWAMVVERTERLQGDELRRREIAAP